MLFREHCQNKNWELVAGERPLHGVRATKLIDFALKTGENLKTRTLIIFHLQVMIRVKKLTGPRRKFARYKSMLSTNSLTEAFVFALPAWLTVQQEHFPVHKLQGKKNPWMQSPVGHAAGRYLQVFQTKWHHPREQPRRRRVPDGFTAIAVASKITERQNGHFFGSHITF